MSGHDPLEQRLSAIFTGLDTRPQFNARLLDRLHREVLLETQRAQQARRLEQLRYGAARQELASWRRWMDSITTIVSLDSVGIAILAAGVVTSAGSAEQVRQYGPLLLTAVGVLLALAPVIAPAVRKWT
jgi:hypothetical protein